MTTAGVPARQTRAAWAVGGSHPHCPACGAFLTRQGAFVSPRCALRRLLDCPALKADDLKAENDAIIGAAQATLARLDEQAMQSLRYLLECPALSVDGLDPETVAAIEAARDSLTVEEPTPVMGPDIDAQGRDGGAESYEDETQSAPGNWWEREQGDEWWKGEEWKELRGQILDLARAEGTSPGGSGRISLAGFSQGRVLPRGCWLDSKEIKGHGPYLYLRWRVGSRQRSKYLGKGRPPTPGPATGTTVG